MDITSLVQTGSWVRMKAPTKHGTLKEPDDLSLLQTESGVEELLPEDFFQEDSLETAALATTEHSVLSKRTSDASVNLKQEHDSNQTTEAQATSRSTGGENNSLSHQNGGSSQSSEGKAKKSPVSYLQNPATVVDSQGNHTNLILQTALNKMDGQDAGDCTPKCTWKCSSPKCDEVCEPKCKPPICETRCYGMETSSCTLDCDQPECAVICPETQCTTGCAECQTTCSKPQCKLKCPGAQPCHNVCEEPECDWQCQAPKSCPAPQCQLQCEKPKNCAQTYHAPLPKLKSGEVTIKSFKAGGEEKYYAGVNPCDCGCTKVITVTEKESCECAPCVSAKKWK